MLSRPHNRKLTLCYAGADMKPWLQDAGSLADAIRRGEVRSADAVEASLLAIEDSDLNTVAYLDAESARAAAAEIDRRIAAGEDPGLFAGVPMLIKDVMHVKGWPTARGSVPLKENIVDYDSTQVERLRHAGAVFLGKSTMSEFGFVGYTRTKLCGITRNPWDLDRTPAGSSGGSSAAVSGGLVPIATGGDGGGSIRLPASYTGLVGMKGTFGRIPRGPQTRFVPLTVSFGVLARSVRDAARSFDVCSGYDARDPHSLPRIDAWEENLGSRDLRGLRVAFSVDLGNAVVHPDVRDIVTEAALALIETTGMQRTNVHVELPQNGIAWARAGLPDLVDDLKDYWPDCKQDLTPEIRQGMEFAPHYRAWHGASVDRFRTRMNEALADLFEEVDVLLCATSPMEPFAAEGPMPNMVGDQQVDPFNSGALTIPANTSGYPAISIPAGRSPNGLPIGLQAYARRHEDALLLDLALAMERARPWPLVAPATRA